MAARKKKKIQTPSLSSFDKGIYILLTVIIFWGSIFLFVFLVRNFRISVFADPHVLAQQNYNYPLTMLGLIPGAIALVLSETLRKQKQPIFGKSGVTYGPPQWKSVYPLFSRAFWRQLKTQPRKVIVTVSWIVLLVLAMTVTTVLVMPLRVCLYDDGTITEFDCLNRPSQRAALEDVERLTLYTETSYRRSGPDPWGYSLKMTTYEGETFYFDHNDFDLFSGTHGDVIQEMTQVKGWFSPDRISIEGTAHLADVVRDMNLSEEESTLLHALFTQP